MSLKSNAMREAFLEAVIDQMSEDESIFFLSADFGSPKLDIIRERFPERFVNVGIAEQNLINVSTGLALEGYTVFAYAIAPFITMRCYEQVRTNLAVLSELKQLNVNLVGVGAGFSYDMSGPSHQAFEDISIMRTLPNFEVISPSDWVSAKKLANLIQISSGPKYFRFDSKPLPTIYNDSADVELSRGFSELNKGEKICLVATGYMTHKALKIVETLKSESINIGLIDMFLLKQYNQNELIQKIKNYSHLITLEEGFIKRSGLDTLIRTLVMENKLNQTVQAIGLNDSYYFDLGNRESLHAKRGISQADIITLIMSHL